MRRLSVFSVLVTVFAAAAWATSPLVRVGQSDDSWEARTEREEQCDRIEPARIFRIRSELAATAVAQLDANSAVALTDEEAAIVLGVDRDATHSTLARQLLAGEIADLAETKRGVLARLGGSWGRVDDENLDRLTNLLNTDDGHPLAPYLVRALAADADRVARFEVLRCGDALRTISYPEQGAGSKGQPDRTALVVLLHDRPRDVLAEWTYDDPELNRGRP